MIILKAARPSQRMFAALLASSCLILAGACSSSDKDDEEATPDEGVSGLQPADGDDGDTEPLPPPAMPNNPPPVMQMPNPVSGGPAPNGLALPEDFLDWRVIGVAMPNGANPSIRVIVGNDIAVNAARNGATNPWPDGSMIGHMVWAQGTNSDSADTIAPGDFRQLTLMKKDIDAYARDGGWAYGVWMTEALNPPVDPNFDRACVNCHTDLVADKDFVFTVPGALPTQAAVAQATPAPNGLKVPSEVLDWRVIGVAQPGGEAGTIRVIVGNDVAVDAARAGKTDPWPENSAISHYVWAVGTNPDSADTVVPAAFGALTFMVRNEDLFANDNDWAFSVWTGTDLAAPTDPQFDRACVNCHTDLVSDNDMVFTRPGVLPER
jgi:cytochrome P460